MHLLADGPRLLLRENTTIHELKPTHQRHAYCQAINDRQEKFVIACHVVLAQRR